MEKDEKIIFAGFCTLALNQDTSLPVGFGLADGTVAKVRFLKRHYSTSPLVLMHSDAMLRYFLDIYWS